MQQHATSRAKPLPLRPRTLNNRAMVRFVSIRTAFWLSTCGESPSPRQATMAESIAQLEWSAEVARRENTLVSLRDLREHLRLRDRLVADLERTTTIKAAEASESPGAALDRHIAMLAERQRDGEDEAA